MEAHRKLLDDLQCHVMVTPEIRLPPSDTLISQREMRALTIPPLSTLLEPGEVPVYQFTKTFEQAQTEPLVALHSSGSTGLPKPIALNHGTVTPHDLFPAIPARGGKEINLNRFIGKRVFFGLAMFHSAQICFVAYSIYSGTIPVFSPSFLPTAAEANTALLHGKVDAAFLPPVTLVEMARQPEYLESVRRLEFLTFGGAPLPRDVGNKLKDHVHLFVSFGATETGYYALEVTENEDWEYVSFSSFMGYELRPYSRDLYKFFLVRQDNLRESQGVFSTFPSIQQYSADDLYSKHPTKSGLWLYEGRSDDIIILSNGLNLMPMDTEGALNALPSVKSALVCGRGRPHASLLVEAIVPPKTSKERSALVAEIWPTVERANTLVLFNAQIEKDFIIFCTLQKPMLKAGKGSVLRKATEDLYEPEFDKLYVSKPREYDCSAFFEKTSSAGCFC
ncbi:MAG: hypothetical protein Q9165_003251 [Trypethelium subeluteriae]